MPVDLEPRRRIPMSWNDYEALAPDARGEYVDGEFVARPLPSGRHQDVCLRLARLVEDALPAGVHVRLSWGWKPGPDEFGPDLTVFALDDQGRYRKVIHLTDSEQAQLDVGPQR
jgi:Uma2 family endonuclease